MNNKKQVARFKDFNVEAVYESLSEAARLNGISKSGISKCCNGKTKTYKGYRWRFVEDCKDFAVWEGQIKEVKEDDQTQRRKTTRHFDWFFRFWLWLMRGLGLLG